MEWSPDNKNRCDSKLCRYATICNLITLFLILVFITGLAQANMSLDRMVVEVLQPGTTQEKRIPLKDVKNISLVARPQKLIVPGNSRKAVCL